MASLVAAHAGRRRACGCAWRRARGCTDITASGFDFLGYKLACAVPPAFDLDAGARTNNTDVLPMTTPFEPYLREFTVVSLVKKNNGLDPALVAHRQLAL